MDELYLQRKIIEQMERHNGYGKKWKTDYAVGVPDLILSHLKTGLVVAEVKLEKDWNKNTARTIDLSQKQIFELQRIRNCGGRTAVLVGITETGARGYRDVALCYMAVTTKAAPVVYRDNLMRGEYDWSTSFPIWLRSKLEDTQYAGEPSWRHPRRKG